MTGAADSEEVTFTYTVRASAVYVSEDGDDGASGTEDKPVETLQRAIKLLDEAQFTEGEIVVTGTVATEEVIINTLNGTTGSVTTLMVRGGAAGAKLENTDGRVFTIGTGGTLTLGENITLTGINNNDTGGAVYITDGGNVTMESGSEITRSTASLGGGVYVNGGTFTMESGSEITGSTASLGGGVYVSTGGTFTMSGGTIGKNDATNGGGDVYMDGGTFTISGGKILGQGNKKEIYSAKTFAITGNPTIDNCTITLEQNALINVQGLNASALSSVQVNLPDDFYAENKVLLENAGSKDICDKFTLDDPPAGVWWIGLDDSKKNGILKYINGTLSGDGFTVTVTKPPYDNGGLQDLVNDSVDGGYKVEITGGGTSTVGSTVSVPSGADVAIKPGNGNTVNINADGATTVFDVQNGGSLTLGGGGGVVNVSGDPNASSPTADGKEISLINISRGGTVTIADNANIQNNQAGRGVTVDNGKLIMTGGSIKDNTGGYNYGSGVYVSGQNASFEMSGGEISNNTLELTPSVGRQGAGVMVCNGAKFTLSDSGKITDNSGYEGVGVTVSGSTFTMNGGEISGNNGSGTSGGVYLISGSTMNMNGGKITRNGAAKTRNGEGAGGVFIGSSCTFTGSTDPDTTAYITENYVANTNVDVYFQSGGNGAYSPGNVQVGNPQNP